MPRRRSRPRPRARPRPRPSATRLAEAPGADRASSARRCSTEIERGRDACAPAPPTRLPSARPKLRRSRPRGARRRWSSCREAREQRGRAEERLSRRRRAAGRVGPAASTKCSAARRTEAERSPSCKPNAPLPDLARHRGPARALPAERERLGGVNLRAEEEANETAARRDALVTRARRPRRRPSSGCARASAASTARAASGCSPPSTRSTAISSGFHAPLRRRRGRAAAGRVRRPARGRARDHRPPAGQEAADA